MKKKVKKLFNLTRPNEINYQNKPEISKKISSFSFVKCLTYNVQSRELRQIEDWKEIQTENKIKNFDKNLQALAKMFQSEHSV